MLSMPLGNDLPVPAVRTEQCQAVADHDSQQEAKLAEFCGYLCPIKCLCSNSHTIFTVNIL
jgi:hypothetical protein